MIENISFSILEAEELLTLAQRIYDIIQQAQLNQPMIDTSMQLIQKDMAELNTTLGKDVASAYSEEIKEKDNRRDRAFMGFRTYLESYAFHLDELLAQQAESLLGIFKKHGTRLHREGNTIQTSRMNLLISDLQKPEALSKLENLRGSFWLKMIKEENEGFEQLIQARSAEQSAKVSAPVNEKKSLLGNHLNKILNILEILEDSSPSPTLGELVARLNEAISTVMTTARSRKMRNQQGKNA